LLLERTAEGMEVTGVVNEFTNNFHFKFGEDILRDEGFSTVIPVEKLDYLGIFGRVDEVKGIIVDNVRVTTNVISEP